MRKRQTFAAIAPLYLWLKGFCFTCIKKRRDPIIPEPLSELSRIVIVGGGAGGIELATRLSQARVFSKITLVDRNATHLWKPRLHEVAVGLTGTDGESSYLAQGHRCGFQFVMGELVGLDIARRKLRIAPLTSLETGEQLLHERSISFDVLVLALGSRVNDFGIPGVKEHCHMLDSSAQAHHLRRSFLEGAVRVVAGNLERMRVGIVGAGATGVELAAELHHAVHSMDEYGGLSAGDCLDITVVDRAARILPAADQRTSARAQRVLERLGVSIRLGQGVERVCKDALHLSDGDVVACDIKIWASGIIGHPVVDTLPGLALAKDKRILVDSFLACFDHPNIFAIGDCAATQVGSSLAPPTAQVAHQQATYLAEALTSRAEGRSTHPFSYSPMGTLISLGAHDAAGEIKSWPQRFPALHTGGAFAKMMYGSLYHAHRATLYGPLRASALFLSDWLRNTAIPPIKLH